MNTTENDMIITEDMVNENMSLMDFNQLMNVMIVCANNEDFRGAEDALNVIQNKFSGQQISNAISKYSQLLKNSSNNSERKIFLLPEAHPHLLFSLLIICFRRSRFFS